MSDPFSSASTELDSPGRSIAAITPSDSVDLTTVARAIYVGGAGDVRITAAHSGTETFVGVSVGQILPVTATRVHATGTTATNLIAIW